MISSNVATLNTIEVDKRKTSFTTIAIRKNQHKDQIKKETPKHQESSVQGKTMVYGGPMQVNG